MAPAGWPTPGASLGWPPPVPLPATKRRGKGLPGWAVVAIGLALLTVCVVVLALPSPPDLGDFAGAGPARPAAAFTSPLSVGTTRHLVDATARVITRGCGLAEYGLGSAWPIAPHYLVTAGHVAAGEDAMAIQFVHGPTELATVVAIDRPADAAVLYVPDGHFQPFDLSATDVSSGPALTVGFPGGNPETGVPLELSGTISMHVQFPTPRVDQGLILQSSAIGPGDSGSAVVDAAGQVVGMVIDGANGVTLASLPSTFGGAVRRAVGRTAGVATGACA